MFIVLFYFFLISSQFGQTEIEKVEVIGKKDESTYQRMSSVKQDPSGYTNVVYADDFKGKYVSLADVLEREAGVRVRRFGGLGSYSTLSIRGTNANQVKIYIDGIPLENAQGGEINLADLGFDNLERIEIYKSGQASGFSGSAIGGSVNLITVKGKQQPTSRVSLAFGSFKTFKVTSFKSDNLNSLQYSLFAQKEKSDQDFVFRNDNGTPLFNTVDDKDTKRKNAWFDRYNLLGTLRYEKNNTQITFINDFNYRMNGIPGVGSNQTEKVKRKYTRNTSIFSTHTKAFFLEKINLDTKTYYTGARDHLFDPQSEFSSGTPNSLAEIQQYGFHLLPSIYLLEYYQVLKFLLALERETFRRDERDKFDRVQDKSTRKFRHHTTFQISDEIKLFKNKFFLTPLIQKEIFIDRFNEQLNEYNFFAYEFPKSKRVYDFNIYKMGIGWIFFQNQNFQWTFKTNASRDQRMPTFLELFGERGSILGNTTLKPEKARSYDFGIVTDYKSSEIQMNHTYTLFSKRLEDMILFVPNSQFSLRPENIDSAWIRGFEWSFKINLKKAWKFQSNYTYQKATNTSETIYLKGKYLPLRPLHEWTGTFSYKFLKQNLEIGYEPVFIGAAYRDRTNEYSNYQPARWIQNLFFYWEFIKEEEKEFSLSLDLRNIMDVRAFDFVGYPLPGRNYYVTLSGKF